jgi:plastocyanin
MTRTGFAGAGAILLGVLALAGCGGGGSSSTETTTTTEATATTTTATASGTTLDASVGPGFDISLKTADGTDVSTLTAGSYTIEVNDQSDIHNFHLSGPGVDESTGVSETGTTTWKVMLQAGSYHYQCDPHASQMNGDFQVSS